MHKKTLYLALVALLVINAVDAKRSRKNKRPKDEDSTPQPNVVTYSTFGFNDVGSYDGFVPSSPDYVNYLNKFNQDSSTRLYAPAFPTALDETYNTQTQDEQSFGNSDNEPQASMLQYPQSSSYSLHSSFYNPALDNTDARSRNVNQDKVFEQNVGEVSAPIYGTKLGSKGKTKAVLNFNNTEFNVYSSGNSIPSEGSKYQSFQDVHTQQAFGNKPFEHKQSSFGEPTKSYQNIYNYAQTHYTTETPDRFLNTAPPNIQNTLKFPKVIDFTKFKQYYPSELDNKFPVATSKPPSAFATASSLQNENPYTNNFEDVRIKFQSPQPFKDPFKNKEVDDDEEEDKDTQKHISYTGSDSSQNYPGVQENKSTLKGPKVNIDYNEKYKYKPWILNYTNDYKDSNNPYKGYQYSTNYSNMTFEFDFSGDKKQDNSSTDEIVPASSNVVDFASYPFHESDYSNFKKIPGIKSPYGDDYASFLQSLKQQETKYDPEEYLRSLYSTAPTTTTAWGSVYKTYNSEVPSHKFRTKRPQYHDDINDDVVHIPKRPYGNKYSFGKFESKPTEWSSYTSHRPHKPKKPQVDWKEGSSNRYKSEEDLLGLRTHDTSHPSYLPSYRPSTNSLTEDYDYKKLVEKWRQSYLKAKFKDVFKDEYEGYSSESRPLHVPVPKPYPIEIPHPVIVPVPQPYPVKVPIPKPVAIPVYQEITVPIEKPVPYPVIKKVPYPVEKHVPVPVEKEVQVPVVRPYPVPVPHIRPVFHHTRPREEADAGIDIEEEDDYMPRPESSKRMPYSKRAKTTRTRARRPSRTLYHDRNRRRWPARRPTHQRFIRPNPYSPELLFSHPIRPQEDFEDENSDYMIYCKRTGNC